MPAPRSRVTADVRRLQLVASKVHVKLFPPVEHLEGVRKLSASSASPTTFENCHANCLEESVLANDVR